MADRNGYIGRAPAHQFKLQDKLLLLPELRLPLLFHLDTFQVILTSILMV